MKIVWDEKKNKLNIKNHEGVDFWQAAGVFADDLAIVWNDSGHSFEERRFYIIGENSLGKLLVVFYTERDNEIRIISARKPTKKERKQYEEGSGF